MFFSVGSHDKSDHFAFAISSTLLASGSKNIRRILPFCFYLSGKCIHPPTRIKSLFIFLDERARFGHNNRRVRARAHEWQWWCGWWWWRGRREWGNEKISSNFQIGLSKTFSCDIGIIEFCASVFCCGYFKVMFVGVFSILMDWKLWTLQNYWPFAQPTKAK